MVTPADGPSLGMALPENDVEVVLGEDLAVDAEFRGVRPGAQGSWADSFITSPRSP